MSVAVRIMWAGLVLFGLFFLVSWWSLVRRQRASGSLQPTGPDSGGRRSALIAIGFFTNLFDTLGIGSFATTTTAYRFWRLTDDADLPGTLNVGHTLPVITQALIFTVVVKVDTVTLIAMIIAAVAGAEVGAGIVTRLPRRTIQWSMGSALLIAAAIIFARSFHLLPGGGALLGLTGTPLIVAVAGNFVLGILMMLGIGLYAPCLTLVSLLGMNPIAAFPIMMGSCAFLMPIGSVRFVRAQKYNRAAAIGIAIGGVPAVLIAAFFIKSLPLTVLNWLVFVVVLYTAASLLWAAARAAPPVVVPAT